MTTSSALLILSCLSLLCVVSATTAPFQDLFVLSCGGGGRLPEAHIFPSHPILASGVNANQIRNIWSEVVADIVAEAECRCSSMPAARAQQAFGATMDNLLRAVDGTANDDYTAYASCGFSATMETLKNKLAITLPAGCTSLNYEAGQPCFVNWAPTVFMTGMTFQVAIQKCPADGSNPNDAYNLPFVSISCSGGACTDLAQPCTQQSDCVASTCDTYAPAYGASGDTSGTVIFSKLLSTIWVDETTPIPAWNISGTGAQRDHDLGYRFLTETLKYINTAVGRAAVADGLRFCGINKLQGILAWLPSYYFEIPIVNYYPLFPFWGYIDYIFGPLDGYPAFQLRNFFSAVEFPSDGQGRLTWAHISSWNGVLDNGVSAVDGGRVNGNSLPQLGASGVSPTGDPTRIGVAFIDCDGGVTITPDSPTTIYAKIPSIHAAWSALFGVEKTVISAMTNPDLTDQQASVRFNPASLEFWLEMTTVHGLFDRGDATVADTETSLGSKFFGYPTRVDKLNMPTSCNLDTYLSTGQCSFQYDGTTANTPFPGLNQGFQIQFTKCPNNPNGPPRVDVLCVGTDCHGIYEPYQTHICKQASECTSGVCTSDLLAPGFASKYFWAGSEDSTCSFATKSTASVLTAIRNALMNVHNTAPTVTNLDFIGYCKTPLQTFTTTNFVKPTAYSEDSSFKITVVGLTGLSPFSTTSAGVSVEVSFFALLTFVVAFML